MFYIIPLSIFAAALIGLGIIIWKKMPFLAKMEPEAHQVGDSIWHDLMPEIIGPNRQVQMKGVTQGALLETEKFVRRIKLFFASIDRLSDSLIQRIRKIHRRQSVQPILNPNVETSDQPITGAKPVEEKPKKPSNIWFMGAEGLRQEEQKLIVSIAQEPKNAALYQKLGDIYMRLKEYTDAKESFQAALKLDPENEKLQDKYLAVRDKLAKETPAQ